MNSITDHKIFTPFTIGRVSLRHRVVMAPLTRLRSEQPGDVPGPLMAQYYEQRTSPGGLQNGTNLRTDVYGGSVEHRARLLLEVVEAVTEIFSRDRAGALNRFGLAYLHVIEPRVKGGETLREGHPPVAAARLRKIFNAPMIVAGGFDREGAMEVLDKGDADLVAFGRHFIANPDLVERFRLGLPLNRYDRSTFYSPGPKGYIDYATHTDLANPSL